jgi:phospholipid/cholesterol/gamma-HCH transport system ATP-binding protein
MLHANWRTRQSILSKIGVLFQGGALFDSLPVWENIAFSLIHHHQMDKKKARAIALEKLEAVDLDEKVADIYPAELSGGMQKRVAVARAIAANPTIIFFDEPSAGLDPIVNGIVTQLIHRCVRDLGATTMTITHDMTTLHHIASSISLLFKGNIIWTGDIKELDTTSDPYVVQFIHGNPFGPFTQPDPSFK